MQDSYVENNFVPYVKTQFVKTYMFAMKHNELYNWGWDS